MILIVECYTNIVVTKQPLVQEVQQLNELQSSKAIPVNNNQWPNPAHLLVLWGPWAESFFNGWKIKILFCDIWKVHTTQMSKPINKQPGSFVYIFFMAAFVLQLQSWEVVTETAKFKICPIWAFTENSLLNPVLWHLYIQVQFGLLNFFLWNWKFFELFFSRKNTMAILFWKNSDSLDWLEMTLLVSPAWKSASLSHLNTLELSLDGKARSYCPTCPSVIHLACVMGLVSQHYEFIQASWIIYRDFHIPSQTLTYFLCCEFFFQQKAESKKKNGLHMSNKTYTFVFSFKNIRIF